MDDRLLARIMAKVQKQPNGCWLWMAAQNGGGYAVIGLRNDPGSRYVHRRLYEHHVGPIPARHDLDHLCRNTLCVNPAHVEPVSHRENVRRGMKGSMVATCPQGHPLTPENLVKSHPRRKCRLCHNERSRQRKPRLLEA